MLIVIDYLLLIIGRPAKLVPDAEEIYVVGFSLSPFDTMARLHLAGVMCERAKKNLPTTIVLIDPNARKLKADFKSIFRADTPITIYQQKAEIADWSELLCD